MSCHVRCRKKEQSGIIVIIHQHESFDIFLLRGSFLGQNRTSYKELPLECLFHNISTRNLQLVKIYLNVIFVKNKTESDILSLLYYLLKRTTDTYVNQTFINKTVSFKYYNKYYTVTEFLMIYLLLGRKQDLFFKNVRATCKCFTSQPNIVKTINI